MGKDMRKTRIPALLCFIVFLTLPWQEGWAQQGQTGAQTFQASGAMQELIRSLAAVVSQKAAEMAFDYRERPVIGVVVADFLGPDGEEVELGNLIGYELRAFLARGNPFHVYGKDHPVSQSLKADLAADPKWPAASQRAFQQNLWRKFKPFPVDVIILGRVSPEAGNRIKVEAQLIPFYQPITQVEAESGRVGLVQEKIVSSPLSAEEVGRALAVIPKPTKPRARLVILSSTMIKRYKYPNLAGAASAAAGEGSPKTGLLEDTGRTLPVADFNGWLNERELAAIKDWKDLKRKDYYNLLAGFEADTIWFDDWVEEGRHLLFFSLAENPSGKQYRTFSESFTVKGGISNYIHFFFLADPTGELQLRIRQVVDPENRALPF